jgi:uncharacterized protein
VEHAAMKWTRSGRRSANIEDRRGAGGFSGIPRAGKIGLPTLLFVLVGLFFGVDLTGGSGFPIDDGGADQFPSLPAEGAGGGLQTAPDPQAELVNFMSFVLDDVQASWDAQFRAGGMQYVPASLVLYDGSTQTAGCGPGSAAFGPFYCPADRKVYLDLTFFRDLQAEARFAAPGDFAQAYVIAHEIGHHVQNLLGTSDEVRRLQQQRTDQQNELSIRLELQADCFAGVWAHSTFERELLERGDLEEGLRAAAAVGDDTVQRQSTGRVTPESWTHGSSDQRMTWFRRGFDSGSPSQCDTFAD